MKIKTEKKRKNAIEVRIELRQIFFLEPQLLIIFMTVKKIYKINSSNQEELYQGELDSASHFKVKLQYVTCNALKIFDR